MRKRGFSICRRRGLPPLAPSEGRRRGRWRMLKAGRRREKWRDSVLVSVAVLLGAPALLECRKRMRGMCCQCGRCAHAPCTTGIMYDPTTLFVCNTSANTPLTQCGATLISDAADKGEQTASAVR